MLDFAECNPANTLGVKCSTDKTAMKDFLQSLMLDFY